MDQQRKIFQKHYEDYLSKIGKINLTRIGQRLDLEMQYECLLVPLFNEIYSVSKEGIADSANRQPNYGTCVILAQYILRFPQAPVEPNKDWVNFKDLKKSSSFNNVNILKTDCEDVLTKQFSNNLEKLDKASSELGGWTPDLNLSYDRIIQFNALPTLSILLLMNDQDEMFPAECRVLFQAHAEEYLDPESIAMTGVSLALNLKRYSETILLA